MKIPCTTCGADMNEEGQWLRCRAHYVEERNQLKAEVEQLRSELVKSRAQAVASMDHIRAERDKFETKVELLRSALRYLSKKIDGYDHIFDIAYEKAGEEES